MKLIEAVILGIVQGLTEFFPVSSSGHLVLLQRVFSINEGSLTFDAFLHVATLVPVLHVFRREVAEMVRRPFSKLTLMVVAGTLPTVLIALVFGDFFEKAFETGTTLGLAFILTGLVLWYAESVRKGNKDLDKSRFTDALFVGTIQGIAILPALSRSGFTISGALSRGFSREFALKFSFLMSIPAILGAAAKQGYEIISTGDGAGAVLQSAQLLPVAAGMLAAMVSGYFAIRFMVKILLRGSLKVFSYYVFTLGALIIADQLFFGMVFEKFF